MTTTKKPGRGSRPPKGLGPVLAPRSGRAQAILATPGHWPIREDYDLEAEEAAGWLMGVLQGERR